MPRYLTHEEKQEITRLFNEGMQQKKIAERMGKARSSVNHFIKHGDKPRSEQNESPDNTIFRHLDYYRF